MSTPAAPAPPRRRRRRWVIIPVGLVLFIVLAVAWFYVRGTSADTTAHNPTQPGRPVSQLYRDASGQTTVRAAILLEQPRSAVWRLVTDFADYDDFLPYLRNIAVEPAEGGVTRMTGEGKSALGGYWPFTIDIHTEKGAREWRVWWDEKGEGEVQVNRGGWALSEPAPGQTLLVLTLEAEVRGNPTFILRNFFLYRLREVLRAVEARLKKDDQE
jgi:hypothetical protein